MRRVNILRRRRRGTRARAAGAVMMPGDAASRAPRATHDTGTGRYERRRWLPHVMVDAC